MLRSAEIDVAITRWMARVDDDADRTRCRCPWFGGVRFVPGLSPADKPATRTIARLSFGAIGASFSRPALAG